MYAVTPAGVRMEWETANLGCRFAYPRLIAGTPPGSIETGTYRFSIDALLQALDQLHSAFARSSSSLQNFRDAS